MNTQPSQSALKEGMTKLTELPVRLRNKIRALENTSSAEQASTSAETNSRDSSKGDTVIIFDLRRSDALMQIDGTAEIDRHQFWQWSRPVRPEGSIIVKKETLVEDYSPEAIKIIKEAAVSLFSLSLFEDSFPLFLILWKKLITLRERPSSTTADQNSQLRHEERCWSEQMALMYCVRSAATPTDLEIAKELVQKELNIDHVEGIDAVMHHMLLYEIEQRQSNAISALAHLDMARKVLPDIRSYRQAFAHNTVLGILSFLYLRRCVTHDSHPSWAWTSKSSRPERGIRKYMPTIYQDSATQVDCHFLETCGGPLTIDPGFMINPCIRKCLEWCISRMRAEDNLFAPFRFFRAAQHLRTKKLFQSLYYALYREWIQDQPSHARQAVSPEPCTWASGAENHLGIPVAELLSVIAFTIVDAWEGLNPPSRPSVDFEHEYVSEQPLVLATELLLRKHDIELARMVLSNFVESRHLIYTALDDAFRAATKAKLKHWLKIQLPGDEDASGNQEVYQGHLGDGTSVPSVCSSEMVLFTTTAVRAYIVNAG